MEIEEEENEDILKLVKMQHEMSAIKKNNDISKVVVSVVSALSEAVEDMAKAHKENAFYDKDLGKSITSSLEKLTEALLSLTKEQKIDITPLAKVTEKANSSMSFVLQELSNQQKELITTLTKQDAPQFDGLIKSIQTNNELISKALLRDPEPAKHPDYSKELSEISKRPTQWKHTIVYRDGVISHIDSKAVN